MSFGERLAVLRRERKLTQYELADRLHFTRGQLANYEQGQREPDYETLQKIADFFNVSVDYLLGKTEVRDIKSDPNGYWFRVDTEGMTPEQRDRIKKEIDKFTEWITHKVASEGKSQNRE